MQNLAVKELQMNNLYYTKSKDIKPNIQWKLGISKYIKNLNWTLGNGTEILYLSHKLY